MRRLDLVGQRFGRLVVTKFAGPDRRGDWASTWHCRCDCGGKKVTRGNSLRQGRTRSCGCLASEIFRRNGWANKVHGEAQKTREYFSWANMKQRCSDRNHKDFKFYGARGIRVCRRWLNNYKNFLADMGRRPSPQHTLDRIDNDGDYEPRNCRWATKVEQRQNQRRKQK